MDNIVEYIYQTMASGVIGNTTYDAIKKLLGYKTKNLEKYISERDFYSFKEEIKVLLKEDEKIKESFIKFQQNHSGEGNNIKINTINGDLNF